MPYLKLPSQTPPGGWRYFQPETQLWFDGNDQGFQDMVRRVAAHRALRNLPRANYNDAFDDVNAQLCERLGPDHCRAKPTENWSHIKRDFSANIDGETALAGSRAFLAFIKGGLQMEEIDEAARRAAICRSCHLNTPAAGCSSCSTLHTTSARILKKERLFQGLHVCAACGCGLQLKVNMPMAVIESADEGRNLKFPAHCWIEKHE
jgi:hypothetical protein